MKPSRWIISVLIAGFICATFPAADLLAQGSVNIDRRTKSEKGIAPLTPEPTAFIDFREDMRELVQDLARFARRYNRNFIILPMNGIDLLTKREDGDEDRRVPARVYLQAIDGMMQEGLYYGKPEFNKPRKESEVKYLEEWLGKAVENGVNIFTLDYADDPKIVSELYAKYKKKGYIPYVAPDKGAGIDKFASRPKRPVDENAKSIVSLKDVQNYAIIRDSSAFGTQAEFAMKTAMTNYDLLVVDPFHRRNQFLSRETIHKLKFKKLGGKRLVLAYLNIAAAEAFRYYWRDHWQTGSPDWLGYPYRGQPDIYHVQYWRPEWRDLLFGGHKSYVYGLVRDLGYDGLVLDGLDAYRYHEGSEYAE